MIQMKLAYQVARTQLGISEIKGPQHNPKIIEYGQATILQSKTDEESWCSNFVNWCYIIAGILMNPVLMRKQLTGRYSEGDIELYMNSAKELSTSLGFINFAVNHDTCEKVKLPTMLGNARSWQHYANESKDPKEGDIVVMWRESVSSWKGHVGFLVKKGLTFVSVLGGNQTDKVCIQDFSKIRILSYRSDDN